MMSLSAGDIDRSGDDTETRHETMMYLLYYPATLIAGIMTTSGAICLMI